MKKVQAQKSKLKRCQWAEDHELLALYHDKEWGVPVHDDRLLFEMLNLEGAQAGLSWLTVLKKREGYRSAFDQFNADKIKKYSSAKKSALMKDSGIVRNRLKINAVIENAKSYIEAKSEFGSFDRFIWGFVNGKPLTHSNLKEATEVSLMMSKVLKKRGFKFVGPTICFAFMQAIGLINDHSAQCFRSRQL